MKSRVELDNPSLKPRVLEERGLPPINDSFELYDLKIEVHQDESRPMICNHPVGVIFCCQEDSVAHFPKEVVSDLFSGSPSSSSSCKAAEYSSS